MVIRQCISNPSVLVTTQGVDYWIREISKNRVLSAFDVGNKQKNCQPWTSLTCSGMQIFTFISLINYVYLWVSTGEGSGWFSRHSATFVWHCNAIFSSNSMTSVFADLWNSTFMGSLKSAAKGLLAHYSVKCCESRPVYFSEGELFCCSFIQEAKQSLKLSSHTLRACEVTFSAARHSRART